MCPAFAVKYTDPIKGICATNCTVSHRDYAAPARQHEPRIIQINNMLCPEKYLDGEVGIGGLSDMCNHVVSIGAARSVRLPSEGFEAWDLT